MSSSILISPAVSLVDEVVLHLRPEGADYSRNLVVFPGKRPAHFVRKVIGEIQGKSYVPPSIHSFDGFVDFLSESGARSGRDLGPMDAAVILYEIHRTLPERIGGQAFDAFERFLPIGLRIFDELEELLMTCLPQERIVSLLRGVSLRGLHSLGTLYERFYPEISRRGFSTRAMKYIAATPRINDVLEQFNTIVVGGMFALSEAERRIVLGLAARKETTLIFQDGPGIERQITGLGLAVTKKGANPEPAEIDFIAAPDSHGEIFTLADRFLDLRESGEAIDHRTVVLVPDPVVLPPLVHHALSLLDDPYNISIGYPNSRTPLAGFLTALMNAVSTRHDDKFQGIDYLNVVLHPFVKSIPLDGASHPTRLLLFKIEEAFLKGELPSFFRLAELEAHEEFFVKTAALVGEERVTSDKLRDHLRHIHETILMPLTGSRSVGDCAAHCIEVLSTVVRESPGRQHMLFRASAETILSSLAGLSQSLVAGMTPDDPAATFSIVRSFINEGRIPLPGTPLQGLQVLGFLETRNLQFDRVFVLNANDDQIPGESGRYSLIPNMVRQELGLATRREREEIAEYYFFLLLNGAKRVTILFTDNDNRTPSRFVEKMLWEKEQAEGKGMQGVRAASYQVTLTHGKPGAIPKTVDVVEAVNEIKLSATALDAYLKCGIQFYYHYVLRLREKEDLETDVDRRGMGSFVHAVLSEYYQQFVGQQLDAGKLTTESLERLVDDYFKRKFGEEEFGNKYLLKIQIKQHLSRFLKDFEIPRLREGSTRLIGVEEKVSTENNGHSFYGTIDRMEERNGSVFIYDYKTTGDKSKLVIRPDLLDMNDRQGWSRAIGSLQLPFYLTLASAALGMDHTRIVPSYLLLGKGSFDPSIEIPLFESEAARENLYPQLEKVIRELLRELADVSEPFKPPEDLQEVCPYCPFTTQCGTEWVKRKGNFS